MFEVKGKYSSCKVFTDNCDNDTIGLIQKLTNQVYTEGSKIRVMPDTHYGTDAVIGLTMTIGDKVVPNLVGGDIGCGMYVVELSDDYIDLKQVDDTIRKYVPAGFVIHDEAIAESGVSGLRAKDYSLARAFRSLGTLGGGNHFIEIGQDSKGVQWLIIHSGSRHLGGEVCQYYQKKGYEALKKQYKGDIEVKVRDLVERYKEQGRKLEIGSGIAKLREQYEKATIPVSKGMAYVSGQDLEDYLHDLDLVQQHACINRETIAKIILEKTGLMAQGTAFHTIHNYIDREEKVLRKGAISAKNGEMVIIPISMQEGSLLCKGKGHPDWNFSAPHGAGRILSRGKAKEQLNYDDFREDMKGIYTTSVSVHTLDESPRAYRSMNEIVSNIGDTVEILDILKPVYNFKSI